MSEKSLLNKKCSKCFNVKTGKHVNYCLQCYNEYKRNYYIKNREKEIKRSLDYNKKNPDVFNRNLKKYRSTEKYKTKTKEWKSLNKESVRMYDKNKNAKRKNAKRFGYISKLQWESLILKHKNKCYWCGVFMNKPTIDHYMPLHLGGEHSINNVVPACLSCNCKKQHKNPYVFANSIGRLF